MCKLSQDIIILLLISLSIPQAQFQSEEVGRHLVDVERLLQAHALQELQLGALDESIRRLVRHGASAEGGEGPKQQLTTQLNQLAHDYDRYVERLRLIFV